MPFDPHEFVNSNVAVGNANNPPQGTVNPAPAFDPYAFTNTTKPDAGGVLQSADDFVRATGNAASFGMADRFAGGMNYLTGQGPQSYSEGVDQEVAKSAAARERSPYLSIAGDVAGSLTSPALGAAKLAKAAAPYVGKLAGRALGYGTTGAATGAAQGAGSTYTENPEDYAKNAGFGSVLGGVLGAIGGAAFGTRPDVSKAATPAQSELYASKNAGYDALKNSGARYELPAFAQRADQVENRLFADRFNPRDSKGTWRGIEEARGQGAPGQPATGYNAIIDPGNIDFIIKGLNQIPRTEKFAKDRESASIVKRAFNDFVENPPPGAVLPGTELAASQASTLARNARGDNAAYKRLQALDELVSNAQTAAGSTGLPLQDKLRSSIAGFTKEKGGYSTASKAGYNRDEIAALVDYARGTNPTNLLRISSDFLGGGSPLGRQIAFATGGVAGGAAGQYFKDNPYLGAISGPATVGTGMLLRSIGNRRANNDVRALQDMIAQRSPLYQYRTMFAGSQPGPGSAPRVAKATRDAITTAILKQTTGVDPNAP